VIRHPEFPRPVAAFAMPLKLNILIAIAAGVASGLLLDRTSPEWVREGA
jgi:hypothetical protein